MSKLIKESIFQGKSHSELSEDLIGRVIQSNLTDNYGKIIDTKEEDGEMKVTIHWQYDERMNSVLYPESDTTSVKYLKDYFKFAEDELRKKREGFMNKVNAIDELLDENK